MIGLHPLGQHLQKSMGLGADRDGLGADVDTDPPVSHGARLLDGVSLQRELQIVFVAGLHPLADDAEILDGLLEHLPLVIVAGRGDLYAKRNTVGGFGFWKLL